MSFQGPGDINKWDQFVIGKINVNFIETLTSRKTIIQILSYLIRWLLPVSSGNISLINRRYLLDKLENYIIDIMSQMLL